MARIALIFPPLCSCSKQIGALQQEFEIRAASELASSGISPDSRREIPELDGLRKTHLARAMDSMGLTKMCCRSAIANCPMYFIRSTDQDRFIDEIGIPGPDGPAQVNPSKMSTPLIQLRVLPPAFPLLPGEMAPTGMAQPQILPLDADLRL